MFEHRHSPLLPKRLFYKRLAGSGGIALVLIVISLGIGMLGYHEYGDRLTWTDAFENAAMILSGMGPVDNDRLQSRAARIFAGFYALYSGFALITIAGVVFAPIFHRFIHKFHLDAEKHKEKAG